MYTTPKRFPAPCRFYSQGNCRAGQDCQFAHILPFNTTKLSDQPIQDLNSIQKAIRNLELDQLEKKYAPFFQKTIQKDMNTSIDLLLPLETKDDLQVQLIVPYHYPDVQCTLQIQNKDLTPEIKSDIQAAFEDQAWHQMRHKTLVQQVDWLTVHFDSL
ncbi:hypothetical protein A0J61_10087 [Choanephora cucurbitarum]|uniref:C3H1-type domain-containing protein n=1 Tax=Choanephora cucurbitarum TaxID=101091 RepID=A0A1C7N3G0_9FUNG|nr:hypothetical protein A0J61_10087 [Choanephora cucurbitarum]